jgi:hypothetical protein
MASSDLAGNTPREAPSKELLQLHLAEYEALTTRCTYFIAIHVGLWGVIVGIGTFVYQEWLRTPNALAVWLGFTAIQAILQLWVTILEEQYLAVSYIENQLRHQVMAAVPGLPARSFWRYEAVMSLRRMHENWWGEWIAPCVLAVVLAFFCFWRRTELLQSLESIRSPHPQLAEMLFAFTNALFVVVLIIRTHLRLKVRGTFVGAFKQ